VCESLLRRVITPCTLKLASSLMSGSDDGFGNDNFARQIAKEKAAAAGVPTAGAKFHPGLCRDHEFCDPYAWYHTPEEVQQKATALGRNVKGSVNVTPTIRDEVYKEEEKRDLPAPDMVAQEAAQVIHEKFNDKPTPTQTRDVVDELRHKHSGWQPGD
jgi:hypothetical protein